MHAEAAVRAFVRRAVAPLRVSTGAIIYEGNCGDDAKLRQIDTMIWSTAMAPAIFECGEFALVPRGNCHVALEIKRSMYSGSGSAARGVIDEEPNLFHHWVRVDNLNGDRDFSLAPIPTENETNILAVFCMEGDGDAEARKLVQEGKAVLLLKNNRPNTEGVLRFVNVLLRARWLSMQTKVFDTVNLSLLSSSEPVP
jgi:hypothetical protein